MLFTRSLAPLLGWLLTCGCALDRRELHAARPSGGAAGEAVPSAGQPPDGGASANGSSESSEGLVDGCADLDTDGIADCTTTLLENSGFSENVDAWHALSGSELSWQPKNALGDLPSGSALLASSFSKSSASQCVPLAGERLVIAYASAFVEGEAELGQATLEVSFFEDPACGGESVKYFETPPSTRVNSWTTIQAGALSTSRTASVSVTLVGHKPNGAEQSHVYFDNVMLKAPMPM
jgi:hypothetical protein